MKANETFRAEENALRKIYFAVVYASPEEYFDPLGPGETYAECGDPKYTYNHEYLDVEIANLEWTECIRHGAMGNSTIRMQYLQNGWLSHNASTPDSPELLILSHWLPDGAEHSVRIRRLSQTKPWKVEHNYLYREEHGRMEELDLELLDIDDR